jgi:hypothetical protein
MPTTSQPLSFVEEIADFLATRPTREQILAFRPSKETQGRIQKLIAKNKQVKLTDEEEAELAQFEQGELFMQLVKARLRPVKKQAS